MLLDQLELQLADLEENAAQAETTAGRSRQDYGAVVRAPQAGPPAAARAFVAGAHCLSRPFQCGAASRSCEEISSRAMSALFGIGNHQQWMSFAQWVRCFVHCEKRGSPTTGEPKIVQA